MIQVDEKRANEIIDAAREKLIDVLIAQRTHRHMSDDCGDYLDAALTNFNTLFQRYNDGEDATLIVNEWLNQSPDEWLACDGEIRFDLPETKAIGDEYA